MPVPSCILRKGGSKMLVARLLFLNIWRNRTRSILTFVGLMVAVLAFGLLSTVVQAWYAGAEAASQADPKVTAVATGVAVGLPALLLWQSAFGGYSGTLDPQEALDVLQASLFIYS